MAGCELDKYVGRDVGLEYALVCGDVDPRTVSFLPIGVHAAPNPIGVGEEIKAHRDWDMSMFKASGAPDIPDFRSSV